MSDKINVFSEIGKLNSIIVHRPGRELLNITPDLMDELLFDEIPYMEIAQKEHDQFVKILKDNDVKVNYIEDLVCESLTSEEIRENFIYDFVSEANIRSPRETFLLEEYLNSIKDNKLLVKKMIEGVRKDELPSEISYSLQDLLSTKNIFTALPMPNLYFTRDAFSLIGNGVCMNTMWSNVRQRETIFGDLIFKNHPDFKNDRPNFWYGRDSLYTLEGGDIVVLSNKVLAVGVSQRTEPRAIEIFANNILNGQTGFEKILCIVLPKKRSYMHLDTVFTMIDRDLFTVFPGIHESLELYEIENKDGEIITKARDKNLKKTLEELLKIDEAILIEMGARGILDADREQWSDGYNTLAIAPREVIVYERNVVINELLDKNNVKLHMLKEGELSRGRGGPRCMSMPMNRDAI